MVRTRGAKIGGALVLAATFALLQASVGCGLLSQEKEEQKKAFGVECAKDIDCESSSCAPYGSICTKGCTYDRDCGDTLVCRSKDSGTGLLCSKPAGSKVGASCMTATECDHGFCLKKAGAADQPGFCSRTCQSQGDCPDGYKLCDTIADNGDTKVCIIGDDKIPIGERPQFTAPKPLGTTPKATPSASGTARPDAGSPPPPPIVDAGAPGPVDAGLRPVIDAGQPVQDAGRPVITVPTGRPRIVIPTKK